AAAKTKPTAWENRTGAASSRVVGGVIRCATSLRNTMEYGAKRSPANAASANTATWAANSHTLPVTSTSASTMVVTAAANRTPRGSTGGSGRLSGIAVLLSDFGGDENPQAARHRQLPTRHRSTARRRVSGQFTATRVAEDLGFRERRPTDRVI